MREVVKTASIYNRPSRKRARLTAFNKRARSLAFIPCCTRFLASHDVNRCQVAVKSALRAQMCRLAREPAAFARRCRLNIRRLTT